MRPLLLAVLLASGAANAAAGAFERGMKALLDGDYAVAYCIWRPLAQRGHADAQYNLGWLYANGNGLNVDVAEALRWWSAAANQGHADAQFAMGLAYTTGEGIGKDLAEAAEWYLRAAKQGHQDAREILGRLIADPRSGLLGAHPELLKESWLGQAGVVIGDRVNLRSGPGTEHPVVAQLERSAQVRLLPGENGWYRVIFDREGTAASGWIFHKLVRAEDEVGGKGAK